jgi:glutaminyl-peptide cyclotransferase
MMQPASIGAAVAALLMLSTLLTAGQNRPVPRTPPVGSRVPVIRPVVLATYPHDPEAFTQGLEYADGFLYESTGQYGRSSVRRVELESGRVVQRIELGPEYFGEGLTIWKSSLVQLTWESELGFVYDLKTLRRTATFRYSGEGWGLSHDSTRLIMSDGSATLRFLDPGTFKETTRLLVTDAGIPVTDLNELEYVNGEIYANVWRTDFIARISPRTGRVTSWLNLAGLLPPREQRDDKVLNGIAYDATGNRLFVTGKLWPRLFEIAIDAKR